MFRSATNKYDELTKYLHLTNLHFVGLLCHQNKT